jgi:hypothetical protein
MAATNSFAAAVDRKRALEAQIDQEAEMLLRRVADYLYFQNPNAMRGEGTMPAVDLIDRIRQFRFGVDCGFAATDQHPERDA